MILSLRKRQPSSAPHPAVAAAPAIGANGLAAGVVGGFAGAAPAIGAAGIAGGYGAAGIAGGYGAALGGAYGAVGAHPW